MIDNDVVNDKSYLNSMLQDMLNILPNCCHRILPKYKYRICKTRIAMQKMLGLEDTKTGLTFR